MLDTIKKMLENHAEIDAWKLQAREEETCELYFVREKIEQSRNCKTRSFTITVYMDEEQDGKTLRGKADAQIGPLHSEQEIIRKIDDLVVRAKMTLVPWYPVEPRQQSEQPEVRNNSFDKHPLGVWADSLASAVFRADSPEESRVNSLEVFITRKNLKLINSEGVERNHSASDGFLEFVVNSRIGDGEEYELYRNLHFSDYEPEWIKAVAGRQLSRVKARAQAEALGKRPVDRIILSVDYMRDFFSYFLFQTDQENYHNKIVTSEIGERLFPESQEADNLSLNGLTRLYNSPNTAPFDGEGTLLRLSPLIKEGVLVQRIVDRRMGAYYEEPVTGRFSNFSISPGSLSPREMRRGNCLEIIVFSDFRMDTTTGDFGGEIRLAYYHTADGIIPITGGSLSANIGEIQSTLRFSNEIIQFENYEGPASVSFAGDRYLARS